MIQSLADFLWLFLLYTRLYGLHLGVLVVLAYILYLTFTLEYSYLSAQVDSVLDLYPGIQLLVCTGQYST